VPLSEHEQRLLDQIERALVAEDPKFASAVRSADPRVHFKRRLVKAAIGFVAGACLLVAGLVLNTMPTTAVISTVGAVLMVFSVGLGLASWRRARVVGKKQKKRRKRSRKHALAEAQPPKSSFMERMEERWRRRHEGQ
jgi:gamma-glutamyl:cysteine ligase YbdK (ATP-grasp superfamily)